MRATYVRVEPRPMPASWKRIWLCTSLLWTQGNVSLLSWTTQSHCNIPFSLARKVWECREGARV